MDLRRDRKRSLKFGKMLRETQRYEQAQDADERRQKRYAHFKMCVINVRSFISKYIYSRYSSQPPCPNLIGSANLNQLVIQRQGEREKLKLS